MARYVDKGKLFNPSKRMLKISEVKSDFRHLTRHIQDTSLILVDTGGMVEISSEEAQVNADKYLKYV